ncbi:hypothetical protein GUJ93_ZPchr0001g30661 [Zizania palustris]|uniref:Fe2OG dioxygenase domain-containing protein n=1 Tax=Zizania palustris TaxID=103762 RepID=A0A8J5R6B8_ZIZPA|nr:hypothetical protein GUJ93_ZPchr0001g30661 [Zizania palustris]
MSLPVPNVQELARACHGTDGEIPDRYVRPEVAADEAIGGRDINSAIPVIDLAKLLDPQSSQEECAKLGSACQHWGFFQLINHGVPGEVISDTRRDVTEFFRLPLEAKEEYSQLADGLQGYGHSFVFSEEQKLDWGDLLYLQLRPNESRDMRFWPEQPTSFRSASRHKNTIFQVSSIMVMLPGDIWTCSFWLHQSEIQNTSTCVFVRNSIERFSSETAKVARCLLKFLAIDMGVDPESLLEKFRGEPQSMRANYYPPCRQAGKVLGLSPHCDATGLTLVLQVNNVQGLQIRKEGQWLAVDALDGALVVNVGDILEVLSNGRYRSIEHRAVVNPEKERISAAVFHMACRNAMVGPLPELVKDDGKAVYTSMVFEDFMKRFFSMKRNGRGGVEGLMI